MVHEMQQTLLYQFFACLDQRDLDRCRAFVAQLEQQCAREPALSGLRDYCVATLVHEGSNDFGDAQRRYRQLLAEPTLTPFLQGQIFISLATAQMQLGDFAGAQSAIQNATTLFRALDLPLEVAKALAQQGLLYYLAYNAGERSGDALAQGVACCEAALNCLRPLPVDAQTGYVWVQVWNTLGGLQGNLLNWSAALASYAAVRQIAEQMQNRYMIAVAYSNSATIRRKLGGEHLPLAAAELVATLEILRQLGRNYELLLTLADVALLHVAMAEHQLALDYFTQALALAEVVRNRISDIGLRAGFIATVSDLYANAVLCAVAIDQLAPAFTYMEQARSRSFLDLLAASESPAGQTTEQPLLTLAQVQQAMPPDALILEYFTTGLVEAPDRYQPITVAAERTTFPPAATLLFVITAQSVQHYRLALAPDDINPLSYEAAVEEHFLGAEMRALLYQQLIAPVRHHLLGKRTLFIIPHGPLHYVPFQALLDYEGRTLLQAHGPQIIFAPSAAILLRSGPVTANRTYHCAQEPNASLIVGCNGNTNRLLAYAEAEAAMIAKLTGGQCLTGAQPKRAQIMQLAQTATLVHFSCHGLFNAAEPLQSALQIGETETLTAQQVIEELKLAGALVTLSACASGLSRVRRGDELFGLIRAFCAAGASTLVVTQWRVDERSTYLLMCKFYELLIQGEAITTALHHAQFYLQALTAAELLVIVAQIRQTHPAVDQGLSTALVAITEILLGLPPTATPFADPYYWAPFMLIYG